MSFQKDPGFDRKLLQAFEGCVKVVQQQARTEIESKKWSHPRETLRKNGDTVSTPRDIVDRGDLRDSLRSRMKSPVIGEIQANVDHAALVHTGYTTITGEDVPAKPYFKTAASEADRLGLIQDEFNKNL